MEDVDSEGSYSCVGNKEYKELSVLSSQLCYETKASLKISLLKRKKKKTQHNTVLWRSGIFALSPF